MSINTFIWGFNGNQTKIIDVLKDKGTIIPKCWIARLRERRRDYKALKEKSIFYDGDFHSLRWTKTYREEVAQYTDSVEFNPEVYNKVYEKLWLFIEQYSRNDVEWQRRSVHNYLNQFNLLYHFFYGIFVKEQIRLVLFSNIPHFGYEWIIYEIAKALNIKTIILMQSPLPDKFLYLDNVEDFGDFCFMERERERERIKLEKKFFADHWYMRNIKKYHFSFFHAILEAIKRPHQLFEHFCYTYLRYLRAKRYKANLSSLVCPVDYGAKYVYFPLHLQPELTTSALGGMFCDQALALELLSKKLPEDWVIYVKENPKQAEFMRDDSFFARLKLLQNVRVTPLEENTFKLIEHSQFVATITGSAGWESICGGKPALVFGKAWYQNLEGVFKWHHGIDLNEIARYQVDHTKLENDYNLLVSKMAAGTTDMHYLCELENYDEETNFQGIAEFLATLIQA